ncbi:hypothetical protein HU200_022199 [Digitaria exilis]|uniref:Uncharacterized protein n=1 Tax=Digitaria exilis TaxID=1010633 RepID=A0A835EVP3_9POAL|nr:hypothetical protein HU200_022199 [Digitaria exilis]
MAAGGAGEAAVEEAAAVQDEEQRREAEAGRGEVRLRPAELLPELRRWVDGIGSGHRF